MAPRKAKTIEPEPVGIEGEHVRVEETRVVERGESSGTNNKLDLILTQLAVVTQTIAHMDNWLNTLEQRRDPPRSHTSSYYRRNEPIGAVSEAFLGDARRASLGGLGVEPPRAHIHEPRHDPIRPQNNRHITHPQLTNETNGEPIHVGERARRGGERPTPEDIRRAFQEARHQNEPYQHRGQHQEGPRRQHENRSNHSMTLGDYDDDLDREIEMLNDTTYVNHEIELRNLKQTSTVQDYQTKFERLSSMVKNRPVESKITHFIGGLNEDIRIEMLRDPPTELRRCFALAKVIEEQFRHRDGQKKIHKPGFVSKPNANIINNKKVIVLLDTGSTHNFLNSNLAHLVGGKVTPQSSFNVLVGNGERMICNEVCKGVSLEMQKTPFTIDLYLLPIGGVDLVLGIQWMKPLKRTLLDWENMTLTFPKEGGGEITLEAINPNVDPKPALRALIANQPAFWLVSMVKEVVGAHTGALQNPREANFLSLPTASTMKGGIICCEAKSSTLTTENVKAPSRACVEISREVKAPLHIEDLGGLGLGDLDPPGLSGEDPNLPGPDGEGLGALSLGDEDLVYTRPVEESLVTHDLGNGGLGLVERTGDPNSDQGLVGLYPLEDSHGEARADPGDVGP
ncbi:hypothetical protein EJ110_NYTH32580 [Nymphaea thermarum]|nr:hypothetical protein EJ110_NYTH32580 [Nymphaea thermarum]